MVEPGADVLGGEPGELLPPQTRYQVEAHADDVADVGVLPKPVDATLSSQ